MSDLRVDEQIQLKKEIFRYLNYWRYFLLSFITFFFIFYLYIKKSNSIYRIETKVKILDENKGGSLPINAFELISKSNVNLDNEIEVFKSKRLMEFVINDLNLTTKYYQRKNFKNIELWNIPINVKITNSTIGNLEKISFDIQITKKGYVIFHDDTAVNLNSKTASVIINGQKILIYPNSFCENNFENNYFHIEIRSSAYTQYDLLNKIKVEAVAKDSDILSVSLEEENVNKAKMILDKIVVFFNDDGINDRRLISKKTIEFIDDRFKYIIKELDSIETQKKNFKQSNYLSFIESDASLKIQEKANSQNSIFEAETQIELSNLLKEELNNNVPFSLLPSNIGLNNEIINNLVKDYNSLVLQRDKLLKSAGNINPSVKLINSEIFNIKNNLNQSILAYLNQLSVNLNQQRGNGGKIDNLVHEIPMNEKFLRSIDRQQKIKEDLYLMLLQKREEASISYAVTSPSLKIIDYANVSIYPIFPKKGLLYFTAFVISILVPFLIIYGFMFFNTKIKSVFELHNRGIPIISEIPFLESNTIFSNKNDRSIHAEVFRILCTNINFLLPSKQDNKGKVLLVTSSIMGEGKTFIASNLALALASYDKKILLIGADLRKPKLSETLGMHFKGEGLSKYLHDEKTTWEELIVKQNPYNPHLEILFSGLVPPNPSSLFLNGRFDSLIEELKDVYDYIVIDSAPTIYVNDTFLISKFVDVTIYVTRHNYTERELLDFSQKINNESKLTNMAYILNSIKYNNGIYSYNYGYGYGYGYGYSVTKNKSTKNFYFYFYKIVKYFKKIIKK